MDPQLGLFDDEPSVPGMVGPAPAPPEVLGLGRHLSAGLRLGTSSWSFPGWAGIVYDRKASELVLAREGLAAYASHPLLRTVGIDRTWYRPVPAEVLRAYADVVPDDFRFLVKADRLLTSPTNPGEGSFRGRNVRFLDPTYAIEEVLGPASAGLGAKAGPILFQFPPIPPSLVGGREAFAEQLHRFLDALPRGPLYAVELRTPGLLTPAYAGVLESTGVAHCYVVHPAMSPLAEQLGAVRHFEQPALVVRWMLHAGLGYEVAKDRYAPFDHIVDEDPESLERISVAALDALIAERRVFVVVNNKAEGSAPLSVFRLARRIAAWNRPDGGSVSDPPAGDAEDGRP
ncbi:MAG: DUF72 domain-containing protein [Gemmatimonadetes bacterium]|nr:DUF72 domain-containing protein [Gemmatimonadota bacterium]